MTFGEFIDIYDNWNGKTCVNDDNLDKIVEENTLMIIRTRHDLFDKEVVSFGFYGNTLTVRVKM